jgi:hypothetical protein
MVQSLRAGKLQPPELVCNPRTGRQMVNQQIMVSQISKSWYRKSAKQQVLTPQTQCTIHDHQMEPEQDQESTSNSKFTAINANAACNLSTASKCQSADPRLASRGLAPTSAIKAQSTQSIAPNGEVASTALACTARQQRNGQAQAVAKESKHATRPQCPKVSNATGRLSLTGISLNESISETCHISVMC